MVAMIGHVITQGSCLVAFVKGKQHTLHCLQGWRHGR